MEKYQKLFEAIDQYLENFHGTNFIMCIEGRAASGKTTLAEILKEKYDCNIFHMDDYFLRPEQKTEERLSIPGENVDHERFLEEVLIPLKEGEEVSYQRYDCHSERLLEPKKIPSKKLNIIEGVYAMHPTFEKYIDLKVFLKIDSKEQQKRILNRNEESIAKKYFETWIPLEEQYFDAFQIEERADIVI